MSYKYTVTTQTKTHITTTAVTHTAVEPLYQQKQLNLEITRQKGYMLKVYHINI